MQTCKASEIKNLGEILLTYATRREHVLACYRSRKEAGNNRRSSRRRRGHRRCSCPPPSSTLPSVWLSPCNDAMTGRASSGDSSSSSSFPGYGTSATAKVQFLGWKEGIWPARRGEAKRWPART
ncbi:hypothetical protein BRADI_1g48641v3 [Brachypodium distachyon]|uniref:Uncharacterized protein n=1 Tax=Brachypodium distachyon TaxID=15368 RepID=A0A0Q3K4S1_BRADI|nr:hypothetical protein BRADI_1g48641v3 [Brachypodium distachyon]